MMAEPAQNCYNGLLVVSAKGDLHFLQKSFITFKNNSSKIRDEESIQWNEFWLYPDQSIENNKNTKSPLIKDKLNFNIQSTDSDSNKNN